MVIKLVHRRESQQDGLCIRAALARNGSPKDRIPPPILKVGDRAPGMAHGIIEWKSALSTPVEGPDLTPVCGGWGPELNYNPK